MPHFEEESEDGMSGSGFFAEQEPLDVLKMRNIVTNATIVLRTLKGEKLYPDESAKHFADNLGGELGHIRWLLDDKKSVLHREANFIPVYVKLHKASTPLVTIAQQGQWFLIKSEMGAEFQLRLEEAIAEGVAYLKGRGFEPEDLAEYVKGTDWMYGSEHSYGPKRT